MAENQPHNLHGRAYKNIVPAMRHALSSGLRAAIYSIPRSKSLRWICGDEPRLSIRRLVAVDFARPYSSGIAIYRIDGAGNYATVYRISAEIAEGSEISRRYQKEG